MEKKNCIIKNGKVVFSEAVIEADILIKDGVITEISKNKLDNPDYKIIQASGKYVLPGIIDAHVHPQYADGFESLSESAAFGGITTLIHYVYAKKGMDLLEKIEEAIDEGSKVSYLDFALHASLQDVENQVQQISKAIELGVTSFKMFMPFTQRGMSVSDSLLISAMDEIGYSGGIAMVHAESSACEYLEKKFIAEGNTSARYYPQTRTNILEAEAVNRAMVLAKTVNCPLYLVHLSAHESLNLANKYRHEGQDVYTETCPHYLTLTEDIFDEIGPLAKCAPPIRKLKDVESMWGGIKTKIIDVVASDHSGYTKSKKMFDNVFESAFGIPGTETLLTLMYDEGVRKGKIDFPKLVKMLSENPAKIFGLYPKKGSLHVGSDADLLIFDPDEPCVIESKTQHGNSDFTLYEGRKCIGKPILTMQRGQIVLDKGVLNSRPGSGNYLKSKVFSTPIL